METGKIVPTENQKRSTCRDMPKLIIEKKGRSRKERLGRSGHLCDGVASPLGQKSSEQKQREEYSRARKKGEKRQKTI